MTVGWINKHTNKGQLILPHTTQIKEKRMGNRAVIQMQGVDAGIYLHWNADTCPQCNQDWDLFHTLDWNNTENYLKCEGE